MSIPVQEAPPPPSPALRLARAPELLAPAGDWECARAAVENGADAIYFGLEKFNARMRAQNFTEADLPALMEFLHSRGVKGYVTFNTLVFENELADATEYARSIIAAGVDAAIVQDSGIGRLVRSLSPDFPLHASTQMTVTSAAGVAFARELGCSLVVLARECSLKEIEKLQAAQHAQGLAPLPLEVFVHGALCVAYSGQCLTSESLGGRSANRGECAQACRMPYDLISDGQQVPLGNRKYLLSPQDLAGVTVLPDLVRLGIASLKIEGRLKSPEYVANITRIYRQEIDSTLRRICNSPAPTASDADPLANRYEMEMAFSRGLYTGWFAGVNNQELVHAHFGKKRGVRLGLVTEVRKDAVVLSLEGPLKAGDGLVFDAGHPELPEQGGRVYSIQPLSGAGKHGRSVLLRFGHGDIQFSRIHVGDQVWKTSDPELERRLRQTYSGPSPKFLRPVTMEVHGRVGQPLTLILRDEQGRVAQSHSAQPLNQARNQPLTTERLREQLGRLGGTPFQLADLKNHLEGSVLLPISELNHLRRTAIAQLEELRRKPLRWTLVPESKALASRSPDETGVPPGDPEVVVLVRNLEQMDAALAQNIRTIYCDFEDPKKYRQAVAAFRASAFFSPGHSIFAAPPRITKMGEEWILNQVRSANADGYLVRNYDHLAFFANDRRIGDYSLNIANHLSADYFRERYKLERLTASYDLNFSQLEAFVRAVPPDLLEVTIHQHMPMFHMEHCVFCAFLSQGTDYTNCGRPCDRHDLKIRDRVGAEHPVKADAGCRNTVFNALAQTGAEFVPRMLDLGLRRFRLEFLNESAAVVATTIRSYQKLLRGQLTGQQLWRELKLFNQLGVTRGQLPS